MLPKGLIVSCQAYEDEPLFGAPIMAAMARAAQAGGAAAIRANGPDDIAAIRAAVALPIVGLWKRGATGPNDVYITPDRESARAIAAAGCDMIAIDATHRVRAGGDTLRELIGYIHNTLKLPVMADVSCIGDARSAEADGADVVSTTLAGYTTHGRPSMLEPDFEFLADVIQHAQVPVVGEGRFATPEQVAKAIALGAHAVVVGAAITRPERITARFAQAIQSVSQKN